ncbi:MAG: NAD(P)H-dependent flavin oxidoreductase [Sphingomonadales bacterium]
MKPLNSILLSGREVLPLIEGGKGVAISNWQSSGAWAAAGGVGTVSCVNADSFDEEGRIIPQIYRGKTRQDRHEELIKYAIKGGLAQIRKAFELAGGAGPLHINVLWEMGGAERVLHGILDGAKDMISGITCGAGMPYKLGEIAAGNDCYYYPIISSARAFRALWKRAYHKLSDWLGGVVYEDPWRAGGHNGLSNSENPAEPQDPYPRVLELRQRMREMGLERTPIIMAGGVWYLRDWADWIDNPELGPIAFQFGTRPLLTRESPISEAWKNRLLTLAKGDVALHRFSPTDFYSSAVHNDFLRELEERSARQIGFHTEPREDCQTEFCIGSRKQPVFVSPENAQRAAAWMRNGFTEPIRTPDQTLIFVSPEKCGEIRKDQIDCMGCLSACKFSSWRQSGVRSTGKKADPRSFCIQKTLQDIAHDGDPERNLMFAGHSVYHFATDPFYSNGFVPTVKELIDRIASGD